MANQQIFCNTPWYEAHIYWDGSLGICCQESRKLHSDNQKYNIKNLSLTEWFNTEPVRQFRKSLLGNTPTDICSRCHHEEAMGGTSRRHRANQKSVIFTNTAFKSSYEQSPGIDHFKLSEIDGSTDTLPIDLHVDLGNYCNLACKMCWSGASSRIATQYVRWGYQDHRQYLGVDWTKDPVVWNRFLNELLDIPKLKNIHFMGGETLLTSRFEEFVDFMIAHERFDICLSFVTNGTTFNESLINKLKRFARVGLELSIETVTEHNTYVRQGTDTKLVLANIQKYQQYCNRSSITLTIRPAISALTVGYYHTLLDYCLEHQLIIKSLLVTTPAYLDIKVLPDSVKSQYKDRYQKILEQVSEVDINVDYNESDPNNYRQSIKVQVLQVLVMLNQPSDQNLLKELVEICRRWDNEFGYDAIELYPELAEVFVQYGY
jgi:sulfatase maturation enzyme AslB (radical SAM superfamily)